MEHRNDILEDRRSNGFTLIEILMAIVIIGILSTVALRSVQKNMESSRIRATQDEMMVLGDAIAGNPDLYANGMRSDFGYVGDVGALPSSLDDLVTNPGAYSTWNGPYIARRFTEDTDGFKKDAWGNSYTFTSGITISSTGGGYTPMTKNVAPAPGDLTNTSLIGSITDAAGNPPNDSSVAVTITVTYPNGAGSMTAATANPNSGGGFSVTGIPVGIHHVEAVYRATDDTVIAFASFLPKDGATVNLRLPGSPFSGSGGGPGGGGGTIEYVVGSAETTGGGNDDIQLDIWHTGTGGIIIQWMVVTYSPSVYYRRIRWDGATVFNETSPRAASGDTAYFNTTQSMNGGDIVLLRVQDFRTAPTGGSTADVSNTDFTIEFSDGSTIMFNSGP